MKRRGVVKGHTIEFYEPLGLPESHCVEVEIHPVEEYALERYGFKPIPAGGNPVTNELISELREELEI